MTLLSERSQGYFSLVRWRPDAIRDEARNIAIILVDRSGAFGGIKAAPISTISRRLHDQGIVDAVIESLEARFNAGRLPDLGMLTEWHNSMQEAIYVTAPKPASVADPEATLETLYRLYVRPQQHAVPKYSKGRILDRVVHRLRRLDFLVQRGQYLQDIIFDALITETRRPQAISVISFVNQAKNMKSPEHDAGHFLFGCHRLDVRPLAVVQEPTLESSQEAIASYSRVLNWFEEDDVPVFGPNALEELSNAIRPAR